MLITIIIYGSMITAALIHAIILGGESDDKYRS